jgi:hypothetical protein
VAVGVVLASANRFGAPGFRVRSLMRERNFQWGAGLFAFLFLIWPVIQFARFGAEFIRVFVGKQIVDRFTPGIRGLQDEDQGIFNWIEWLVADNPIAGVLYLASLIAVFAFPRFRGRVALRTTALFLVLACLALSLASGKIYARYLVPLIPLFGAVLSAVLVEFAPKPTFAAVIGAAILAIQVPMLREIHDNVYEWDLSVIREASERVAAHLRDHENPVFIKPISRASFPPGAFVLFAKLDRHALIQRWDRAANFPKLAKRFGKSPPYMGVAHQDHISVVEEMVGPVQTLERVTEWVIWRQRDPEPGAGRKTTGPIDRSN